MTPLRHIIFCLAALSLTACGTLDFLHTGYSASPLDLQTDRSENLKKNLETRVTGINDCFAASTAAADCKAKRNQAIAVLMADSVRLCAEHMNSIYGREAAFNIATGSLAALASGLAAISPEARASTLSAISAFATSERALVNESIYKTMLTTAIGTKISQLREQKGAALFRRKAETLDSFGVDEAISEVLAFHETCSFRVGLQTALAEGTQTTTETKRQQLEGRAAQLMNQIAAYAKLKGIEKNPYTIDKDGKSASDDAVLQSLVNQYLAVSHAIQDLLPEIGKPAAKDTGNPEAKGTDKSEAKDTGKSEVKDTSKPETKS